MRTPSFTGRQSLLVALVAIFFMHGSATFATAQDNKYPKPDFSAMEEYYEIIKYEYDFTASIPSFTVVAKRKAEKVPKWWIVKWLDADGVVLTAGSLVFDPGYKDTIDNPIGNSIYAPWKREMPKVKRITVSEDNK